MSIVSFIGPPGCGKSTQIRLLQENLSNYYDIYLLSIPALVRGKLDEKVTKYLTECEKETITNLQEISKDARDKGHLAPLLMDEILFNLAGRIEKEHGKKALIILDGPPRGILQAELYLHYQALHHNTLIFNLAFPEKSLEHSVSRQFIRQALRKGVEDAEQKLIRFKNKYQVYEEDTKKGLELVAQNGIPVYPLNALEDTKFLHLCIYSAFSRFFEQKYELEKRTS